MDIRQIKNDREFFLRKVYEKTEGNESTSVDMWEIGRSLGFDRQYVERIYEYLKNEDLIETFALGGAIVITHRGIKVVENIIESEQKESSEIAPVKKSPQTFPKKEYDVFICHVSEDKEKIAKPLYIALEKVGIRVWYDETELEWGKGLRRSIEKGLISSRYGVVLLSRNFLDKEGWAQKELDALEGKEKVLPVWCGISREEIQEKMPMLADRYAKRIDSDTDIGNIVAEVQKILKKDAVE